MESNNPPKKPPQQNTSSVDDTLHLNDSVRIRNELAEYPPHTP